MATAPPPSEPDGRISRIRLSSQWLTSMRIDRQMRRRFRGPTSNLDNTTVPSCVVSHETCQHGKSTMNSILRRAPAEKIPTRLAMRHSRQLVFCSISYNPSTFLRSLRSIPVTGLLCYYGRSDSCSAGSSVPYRQHEHRLCSEQVSLLHAPELPIPPSPTTPQSFDAAFARYPSARRISRLLGSRLHLRFAGSPALTGRIEFVNLRMDRSPPVAPHPASRRRSYSRLQAGERLPEGDFHPSVQYNNRALAGARNAAVSAAQRY